MENYNRLKELNQVENMPDFFISHEDMVKTYEVKPVSEFNIYGVPCFCYKAEEENPFVVTEKVTGARFISSNQIENLKFEIEVFKKKVSEQAFKDMLERTAKKILTINNYENKIY